MQIKRKLKNLLIRFRLWYPLNTLRWTPDILCWLNTGCSGVAPQPIKLKIVCSYIKRFSVDQFIETGTYLGDTLNYIAERGIKCVSIELSEELHRNAVNRFNSYKNVTLFQGDSAERLPELLQEIYKPALFWLDGHYSSGVTASAKTHTPISTELEAILRHPIKQHVILIDDAHCFNGTNGYPHLDDFLRVIRDEGSYFAEVSTDIIRLIPTG